MNILNATIVSLVSLLVAASPALADEAVLQSLFGQVTVKVGTAAAAVRAKPGMKLPRGAEVTTAANSRAIIRFNATDTVRLAPRTTLVVSEVNQNTATSKDTIVRVLTGSVRGLFNRTGKQKKMNFAVAAGGAVCAVKGTEFDVIFTDPGQPPQVVVSQGTVQVGHAGPDMGAVMAALHSMGLGQGGTPVPAGFRVRVDDAGRVSIPAPSPVRTTLEVVSTTGKVMATVNGVTTEVQPGEEIPAGATVQVTGGEAVLSSPGESVSAGAGSTFTFNATPGMGGVTSSIAVAAGSTPVQVETGGSVATVTAGSTVQVSVTSGAAPTISATNGTVSVTNAAGVTTTVAEGTTVSTAVGTTTATDPTTGQTTTTVTDEITTVTPPPPDMPPDTTNQTNTVISPSAP